MADPQTMKVVAPEPDVVESRPVGGVLSITVLLSLFASLLVLSYWPMLKMTGVILVSSEDMAHGFFAPIVAGYLAWQFRGTVLKPAAPGSGWGLAVLLMAAALGVMSTLAQSST